MKLTPNLHRAIDFLTSEEMLKYGDEEHLKRLQHELINKDWFQTLPDFNAYVVRKEQAMKDYAVNPEALEPQNTDQYCRSRILLLRQNH